MRETARKLKLSDEEYDRIVEILGREPNYTEIGIFSVMWSEHCSYKSSLVHLKKFPKDSDRSLTKMGEENAGVLRLKDKWAVAFKMESHNHPSAVAPFQGAATGVGGILRDIFCMGAYPIASLDSLHFGELDEPITRHLFDGVVRGISFYGNCFGVPTVAGEVRFDHSYTGNPLVNVMAVGIVNIDDIISAKATGVGNPVVYIGSSTGRDGIHGASFASDELTEQSDEDRPSVQIGDPFTEKLLLEATQEIAKQHLAVGMQDMGAAGLTSSSAEMASKGGVGIELNLDLVPLRAEDMTPYEIMLSESQERMLLVSTAENLPRIEEILRKWDLHYAVIGRVIEEPVLRLRWRGKIAAEIPVDSLDAGKGAPVYDLPRKRPDYLDELNSKNSMDEWQKLDKVKILEKLGGEISKNNSSDLDDALISAIFSALLSSPTIASKRWVYRQYDYQVGVRTVVIPGAADSAVMRIMDTGQFLAISTDCNGGYSYLDPYSGGALAVLESARNVAAVGAKPIGITDCLNFGNPKKPAVMWQFARACEGISDACKILDIPVTGGNVSFYNESPKTSVFPTPVIGMVGIIEDEKSITPMAFQRAGDVVYVLGETDTSEIDGSQFQKLIFGKYFGRPPKVRLDEQKRNIDFLLSAIENGLIEHSHDISDGGLAVALAECAMKSDGIGVKIEIPQKFSDEKLFYLFSESQGRFIIGVHPQNSDEFEKLSAKMGVLCVKIGETTNDGAIVIDENRWDIDEIRKIYESAIPDAMKN